MEKIKFKSWKEDVLGIKEPYLVYNFEASPTLTESEPMQDMMVAIDRLISHNPEKYKQFEKGNNSRAILLGVIAMQREKNTNNRVGLAKNNPNIPYLGIDESNDSNWSAADQFLESQRIAYASAAKEKQNKLEKAPIIPKTPKTLEGKLLAYSFEDYQKETVDNEQTSKYKKAIDQFQSLITKSGKLEKSDCKDFMQNNQVLKNSFMRAEQDLKNVEVNITRVTQTIRNKPKSKDILASYKDALVKYRDYLSGQVAYLRDLVEFAVIVRYQYSEYIPAIENGAEPVQMEPAYTSKLKATLKQNFLTGASDPATDILLTGDAQNAALKLDIRTSMSDSIALALTKGVEVINPVIYDLPVFKYNAESINNVDAEELGVQIVNLEWQSEKYEQSALTDDINIKNLAVVRDSLTNPSDERTAIQNLINVLTARKAIYQKMANDVNTQVKWLYAQLDVKEPSKRRTYINMYLEGVKLKQKEVKTKGPFFQFHQGLLSWEEITLRSVQISQRTKTDDYLASADALALGQHVAMNDAMQVRIEEYLFVEKELEKAVGGAATWRGLDKNLREYLIAAGMMSPQGVKGVVKAIDQLKKDGSFINIDEEGSADERKAFEKAIGLRANDAADTDPEILPNVQAKAREAMLEGAEGLQKSAEAFGLMWESAFESYWYELYVNNGDNDQWTFDQHNVERWNDSLDKALQEGNADSAPVILFLNQILKKGGNKEKFLKALSDPKNKEHEAARKLLNEFIKDFRGQTEVRKHQAEKIQKYKEAISEGGGTLTENVMDVVHHVGDGAFGDTPIEKRIIYLGVLYGVVFEGLMGDGFLSDIVKWGWWCFSAWYDCRRCNRRKFISFSRHQYPF